jgi:glutamate/tyrosine decarboxylase-like PLP-dependent enzyme
MGLLPRAHLSSCIGIPVFGSISISFLPIGRVAFMRRQVLQGLGKSNYVEPKPSKDETLTHNGWANRPGALIAGCWAALMKMGEDGYLDTCKQIIDARRKIQTG